MNTAPAPAAEPGIGTVRRSKRELSALYCLECAVLAAIARDEPVGRSHAVQAAQAALLETLEEEL